MAANNLLQVRRGNEGIIQVSQQAYNDIYKGAGYSQVGGVTTGALPATSTPTTKTIAQPGQVVNQPQTSVGPVDSVRPQPLQVTPQQTQQPTSQIPFRADLNDTQKAGITNLVNSGRAFNETDAKNYAYAIGDPDYTKYVGKTAGQTQGVLASKPTEKFAASTGAIVNNLDASILGDQHVDSPLQYPDAGSTKQTDFDAFINSILSGNQSPEMSQLQQNQQDLLGGIAQGYEKLATKGDRTKQMTEELGINADTAKLKEVNLDLAQKVSEYQQANLNIQNQPIPLGLIRGQQQQLQQQAAIDIGVLQGQAQALQGNIELAYNTLDRAIDAEFEPIQQQIDATKFFLEQNQNQMTSAEAKQAEKINIVLSLRQQAIDAAKEEKGRNRDLMLTVAQEGGDPRVIDMNKSFEDNLDNAQPFLKSSSTETEVIDYKGGKALIDSDSGEIIKEYPAGSSATKYTKDQMSAVNDLITQQRSDPDISTFAVVRDAYNQILNGAKSARENPDQQGPGDLSIIYGYIKMIDPSSSVKEGEILTVENSKGLSDKVRDELNKARTGGLNETQRSTYVNAARGLYDNKAQAYQRKQDFYGNLADINNVDRKDAIWDVAGTKTVDRQIDELRSQGKSDTDIITAVKGADPKFSAFESQMKAIGKSEKEILDTYYEERFGQPFNGAGGVSAAASPIDITAPSIASLSKAYEGGTGSVGYDSTGGWSYGSFQLTQDNVGKFVQTLSTIAPPLAVAFYGLKAGTAEFNAAWKALAQNEPQAFEAAQTNYIKERYFDPVYEKLSTNLDKYSPVLKQVLWSTSVQHGPAGAISIISSAVKAVGETASEDSLIKKIYELRWGNGSNFRSSTKQVASAVKNRLVNESKEALARLKQYSN